MHSIRKFIAAALFSAASLAAAPALAQTPNQGPFFTGGQTSIFPNFSYAAQSFTATAQTGAVIGLPGLSSGLIEVKGTALTTVTFAVMGSIDGGLTYTALPVAPIAVVPLIVALTATAAAPAPSFYAVDLSCVTNVKIVTSSTFTGTGVTIKLTGSANKGLL